VKATLTSRRRVPADIDIEVHYVDAAGIAHAGRLAALAKAPLDTAKPARRIPSYRGQRHTPGFYWAATTKSLLPYESFLESQWMTLFDFDPDVTSIVAQPFRLAGTVAGTRLQHVPDLLIRRGDQTRVVDVKHPALLDDDGVLEQARLTTRCCDELGWDYELVGAPDKQRWANVAWLSGFRRTPVAGMDLVPRLLALASIPVGLDALTSFVASPAVARAVVFHLCWRHELVFDLDTPLTGTTRVRTPKETR